MWQPPSTPNDLPLRYPLNQSTDREDESAALCIPTAIVRGRAISGSTGQVTG